MVILPWSEVVTRYMMSQTANHSFIFVFLPNKPRKKLSLPSYPSFSLLFPGKQNKYRNVQVWKRSQNMHFWFSFVSSSKQKAPMTNVWGNLKFRLFCQKLDNGNRFIQFLLSVLFKNQTWFQIETVTKPQSQAYIVTHASFYWWTKHSIYFNESKSM